MHLSLPTIEELVARQIKIQDDVEAGDIPHDIGMSYITNLSKIIAGAEIAEQTAKEEPKEEEAPTQTFADDDVVDEEGVRRAMVSIYSHIETGKISPAMGMARIKTLETIARTFKNSTPMVEVNINHDGDGVANAKMRTLVDAVELKIRNYHEDIKFLTTELAYASHLPIAEVQTALLQKRSLALSSVGKSKSNGKSGH